MGEVIVIEMCMDRRLVEIGKVLSDVEGTANEKLRRLDTLVQKNTGTYKKLSDLIRTINPDDTVYVIANAGANVNGHAKTLEHIGEIDRFVILTHTDTKDVAKGCGAMGALSQRIENKEHDGVFEHLGGESYLEGYTDRKGIEELNPIIQKERAKKYVSEPEIIPVDTSHLILPKDTGVHVAVVADPSKGMGYATNLRETPAFETYAIVGRREDVGVDVEIAKSLGMHEIINRQRRTIH
ncbi:MAG: hypothetical protein KGH64_02505 [Candidatus Micrarchaeota archaeon]|nr:hypothetical protein [Candidatus Micrarchaeota archaeon]MDE1834186.1 hypothetical protein [Candidatus Micrarchaeota archaeon]MDE1859158.1 hypothetical protein [Candidatus Micrarchaeota archaeon]